VAGAAVAELAGGRGGLAANGSCLELPGALRQDRSGALQVAPARAQTGVSDDEPGVAHAAVERLRGDAPRALGVSDQALEFGERGDGLNAGAFIAGKVDRALVGLLGLIERAQTRQGKAQV